MVELKVNKLSAVAWDIARGDVDFQIRLRDGVYAIDVFDRTVKDTNNAYLASYSAQTWHCVEAYVLNFNPETAFPRTGLRGRSQVRPAGLAGIDRRNAGLTSLRKLSSRTIVSGKSRCSSAASATARRQSL